MSIFGDNGPNHWCTGARWCEKAIWDLEKRVKELEGDPLIDPRGLEAAKHASGGIESVIRAYLLAAKNAAVVDDWNSKTREEREA